MGEFPTDYFFNAMGEVGEAVEALEEPVAGHREGRRDRVGVGWIRQEDAVDPEASKVGGVVEYLPVRRVESIMRVEKSSALPRSVVDRGAARTRGVWRPRRIGEGSSAVPRF
jgi:hypothetical protein